MNKLTYILFSLLIAMNSYAEQINVNFKAQVSSSEFSNIKVNELIEGTLSYDASLNSGERTNIDTAPFSEITAKLSNGLIVKTALSAQPFLNIKSYIADYYNGIYKREISFSSQRNQANTPELIMDMGLFFDEVFYYSPAPLKTEWSSAIANYQVAEFYININGAYIIAQLTEITTNSVVTPAPNKAPFTVFFKAKVTASETALATVNEIIAGTLTYDISSTFEEVPVSDTTPSSEITATLANGLSAKTSLRAKPFLNINSFSTDYYNGIYKRDISFASFQNDTNAIAMVLDMGLVLSEVLYQVPTPLKTDWTRAIDEYERAEFYININGSYVYADIIEITTNVEHIPADTTANIALTLSLLATPFEQHGGNLQVANSLINTSEVNGVVKHREYIPYQTVRNQTEDNIIPPCPAA